ncbi:MAG: hypothetical protein EOP83_12155 [Verrucomicrobiaceae bacterium]|nr:MAG: hypothetical protein EOP83_12155 [Verrucomicrobiaceae bacterium]
MRIPPERRVNGPEFGLYRTLEGWAIWAVFPIAALGETVGLKEFQLWCAERSIRFDINRISDQYWNAELGAIVTDNLVAMDFKMRWVTHKVEYVI